MPTDVEAQNVIRLTIIDDDELGAGNTKGREKYLVVIQYDNILYMPPMPDNLTLQLRGENGYGGYTAPVPAGTTEIVLPSTLTGAFELRLVGPTYYYVGSITL